MIVPFNAEIPLDLHICSVILTKMIDIFVMIDFHRISCLSSNDNDNDLLYSSANF